MGERIHSSGPRKHLAFSEVEQAMAEGLAILPANAIESCSISYHDHLIQSVKAGFDLDIAPCLELRSHHSKLRLTLKDRDAIEQLMYECHDLVEDSLSGDSNAVDLDRVLSWALNEGLAGLDNRYFNSEVREKARMIQYIAKTGSDIAGAAVLASLDSREWVRHSYLGDFRLQNDMKVKYIPGNMIVRDYEQSLKDSLNRRTH